MERIALKKIKSVKFQETSFKYFPGVRNIFVRHFSPGDEYLKNFLQYYFLPSYSGGM